MTDVKLNLTAVKTNLTAVKTNLTAVKLTDAKNIDRPAGDIWMPVSGNMDSSNNPADVPSPNNMDSSKESRDRHVVRKVRIGVTKYIQSTFSKVQIGAGVTKYNQSTVSKVRIGVTKYIQSTFSKVRIRVPYAKVQRPHTRSRHSRTQTPERHYSFHLSWVTTYLTSTPYGPHNLPHMVLCTKKGPDNA